MASLRNIVEGIFAGLFGDPSSPAFMIATIVFLAIAAWAIREWNRKQQEHGKPGMTSYYFIGACGLVALFAVAVAAYGLALRANAVTVVSNDPIISDSLFLKDDGDSIVAFGGRFARDGTNLVIKLTYGDEKPTRTIVVDERPSFRKGVDFRIPLVTYDDPNQKNVMRWGSSKNGPSDPQDRFGGVIPHKNVKITASVQDQDQEFYFVLRPKFPLGSGLVQKFQSSDRNWEQPWPNQASQNLELLSENDLAFRMEWSTK